MAVFAIGVMSLSPLTAQAKDLEGNEPTVPQRTTSGVDCTDDGNCAKKTSFSFCGRTTSVGISCLFTTILNFMSITVGIAVVGGVTAGGIMYSASGGNPGRKAQGTKIIGNSIIGLVIYLLLWAIVQFLIPGGVFSR